VVASIKPHRDAIGLSDGLHAAFGGHRQSGIGRESGRPAIESYTELKAVLLPLTDEMM
jgi:acyl-CoA reductase-like NAD-dependent aldehyde dehydrogenase